MIDELVPIPDLTGYSISVTGLVYKDKDKVIVHPRTRNNGFKSGFVGSKYSFNAYGRVHNKFSIIKKLFGEEKAQIFRESEYFKPITPPKKYIKKEGKYKKDKRIKSEYRNPLLLWYEVSGRTGDNYQNYFDSRGKTIEQIIDDINNHIQCENCTQLIDMTNLTINWSNDVVTHDWLSFNLLLYFHQRVNEGNGYFAAKFKLTDEEYKQFGYISQNMFKINLSVDYEYMEDSEEVKEFKHGKSNHQTADHTISNKKEESDDFEEYKLDYNKFNTYQSTDCAKFVFDNLIYYTKENISDVKRISKKHFNDELRHLIKLNDNKFSLSEIFCEWVEYYFLIENGIRRLDPDLMKKIMYELGYEFNSVL